jgi:para-nitrobenzyl esterase
MAEALIAHTAPGNLQGIQHEGIIQFRGVPYATSPVGDQRFAPPQAIPAWSGVRNASQHGPIAPQLPSRLRNVVGDFSRPQSEDCLTLTISTPAPDTKGRPVLVWLHGGGFVSGAGSLDWYDGAHLAREGDLVVVGINYRLGALGFLYQPGISNGQLGLLDTIAALRWVHEHIRSFGGDPERVCVMGQSGGAYLIMCLLAMSDTRKLFRRAILQSAPAGFAPLSEATALETGNRLLDLLKIERGQPANIAARLRAESPARILEATEQLARLTARFGQVAPPFMPVIEELSTPERFIAAAAEGAGTANVDLIIGTTREETNAFFCGNPVMENPDPAQVAERFATLAGREDAIEDYHKRRPGGKTVDLLSDLITDHAILRPSLRLAKAATQAGARVRVYQFDWAPPTSPLKACHCLELPLVFGTLEAWRDAPMLRGADPAILTDLSATIRSTWIGFVNTGNPSLSIPWPRYQMESRQTMLFAEKLGPVGNPAGIAWQNDQF